MKTYKDKVLFKTGKGVGTSIKVNEGNDGISLFKTGEIYLVTSSNHKFVKVKIRMGIEYTRNYKGVYIGEVTII